MRGVIIYTSKYGATRQYAEWLGEMLQVAVKPSEEVVKGELNKYDFILLGTPVYFGTFKLRSWLRHHIKELVHKKLFLFIVNATNPQEKEKRNKFIEHNIPAELKHYCKYYFLPGRVIHQKLSFRDKLLLKFAAGFEKYPEKRKALNEDLNGVNKDELLPLLDEALVSFKV